MNLQSSFFKTASYAVCPFSFSSADYCLFQETTACGELHTRVYDIRWPQFQFVEANNLRVSQGKTLGLT